MNHLQRIALNQARRFAKRRHVAQPEDIDVDQDPPWSDQAPSPRELALAVLVYHGVRVEDGEPGHAKVERLIRVAATRYLASEVARCVDLGLFEDPLATEIP